jgi:hypothetical protein
LLLGSESKEDGMKEEDNMMEKKNEMREETADNCDSDGGRRRERFNTKDAE